MSQYSKNRVEPTNSKTRAMSSRATAKGACSSLFEYDSVVSFSEGCKDPSAVIGMIKLGLFKMLKRLKPLGFLIVFSFLVSPIHAADDLAILNQLARGGAPELALNLLSQNQPAPDDNIAGWIFFEQQRIEMMRNWSKWRDIEQRLSSLPNNVPPSFKQWAGLQRVDALLQLGESSQARGILQQLIWQPFDTVTDQMLSLYRRLIVRSYLMDDQLLDAQNSIHRYEQDYGAQNAVWKVLYSRVMIRLGRYDNALHALNAVKGHEAKALSWMAGLKNNQLLPSDVIKQAQSELDNGSKLLETDRLRYLVVMALAAKISDDVVLEVTALENALAYKNQFNENDTLFSVSAWDIWQLYKQIGLDKGNAEQLLIGDDESWSIVSDSIRETSPVLSRAMDIVIAADGQSSEVRDIAQENITDSYKTKMSTFHALMLDADVSYSLSELGAYTRYTLLEYALSQALINDAARWVSGLRAAPTGVSQLDWDLQRARIAVLSGDAQEGEHVLVEYLHTVDTLADEDTDKMAQVVFDMQTVEAHQQAISVLVKLLSLSTDAKRQRELYFWLADSFKALEDNTKAAAYYLRSATLLDGQGFDPWGQTARFNAAEVLLSGGILGDAERLFKQLLTLTVDPARKAVIRQKLQELLLKKNH